MTDIGPGDVVVCVDNASGPGPGIFLAHVAPPVGVRLTVSWVGVIPNGHSWAGTPVLGICGYPNRPDINDEDLGWRLSRFRKASGGDLGSLLKALDVTAKGKVSA